MRETYQVFVIQAYETKDEMGRLNDVCSLELIAKTEEEAMTRAKEIVKKSFYRTAQVIEKYV